MKHREPRRTEPESYVAIVPVEPSITYRRGANWVDPATGERCFIAPGDSETCVCGRHISRHYGGVEYRCDSR